MKRAAGTRISSGALVKLVRTHTELMNQRFRGSPGRESAIALDLPFPGTFHLDIKARGEHPTTAAPRV